MLVGTQAQVLGRSPRTGNVLHKAASEVGGAVPFTDGANTTITDVGSGWYRITKTGGVDGVLDAFAYATEGFAAGYTCRFRWPNVNPDEELNLWITKDDPPTATPSSGATALMENGLSYGDGYAEITRESGATVGIESGSELVANSGTGAMVNWSLGGEPLFGGTDGTNGTTPSRPGCTIKTLGAFLEIKLS
jgi:hypothetical protein